MIIGEIVLSATNKTVVSINEYRGNKTIDVRDWFKKQDMADWQPTTRGVKFKMEEATTLVGIFERVEDEIRKEAVNAGK